MVPICVGCEVGEATSSLTTILSVLGAATGLVGTLVGVLGFLEGRRSRSDALFREEFERHRVPLETSIQAMKKASTVLKASAHGIVPLATLVGNFRNQRPIVDSAVEALLSEADEIDLRQLTGTKWVPKLRPSQLAIEGAWDVIDDAANAETSVRQAAATIIASLDALVADTRDQISSCVRVASLR